VRDKFLLDSLTFEFNVQVARGLSLIDHPFRPNYSLQLA
jgi:hypothetical protein